MRTFENLKFEKHLPIDNHFQAIETFENGYGVSVLLGNMFHSNGINTYSLAVLHNEVICYDTDIANNFLGYLSKEEVSEIMIKVQSLKTK